MTKILLNTTLKSQVQFLSSELRLSQTEKAFCLVLNIVETVHCTWLLITLLVAMHQSMQGINNSTRRFL